MIALLLLLAQEPSGGVYVDGCVTFTVIAGTDGTYSTHWARWDVEEQVHMLWCHGSMRRKQDPFTFREVWHYPDPVSHGTGVMYWNPLEQTLSGYGYVLRKLP